MNNEFDELAKNMAQSVTRRRALKKFGFGLAGIALASLGLANKVQAANCKPQLGHCHSDGQCCSGVCIRSGGHGRCG